MAKITLKGSPCRTSGELPRVGDKAPDFTLTNGKLEDVTLGDFAGRKKLISVFPSVDTPVCAMSTKKFNDYARDNDDAVMLMVSADLPFAQGRFCGEEGLDNVHALSTMRSDFGERYGLRIEDGPLAGLNARAVIVLDERDIVRHVQLVPEIAEEPDYEAALAALH